MSFNPITGVTFTTFPTLLPFGFGNEQLLLYIVFSSKQNGCLNNIK